MHYYKFNISDWQSSTRHLTPEEEGVYFRLINYYYDTEKPIPLETQPVIRRLMLGSHSDTVTQILDEFFVKTEKGYEKEKCNELIREYKKTASKNRKNGALGGRPSKDRASKETQSVSSGIPDETEGEATGNLNQEPITTNQEPVTSINNMVETEFDRFWKAGMVKIKKQQAFAAFKKIAKKQKDLTAFVDHLVFDIQWRLENQQMGFDNLHPSTYLNNERWNDERRPKQNYQRPDNSLASESERQTRIILAQCEAEEAGYSNVGQDGSAIPAQVDQGGRPEDGGQPIDAEFYPLVSKNGGVNR